MRGGGDCRSNCGLRRRSIAYQVAGALSRTGGCAASSDYTTPVGGLYAVYPSSRHVSPLVKAFIELAAARLAASGTGEDDKD
jgi:DNA-binding transcriptional LysR family regulator